MNKLTQERSQGGWLWAGQRVSHALAESTAKLGFQLEVEKKRNKTAILYVGQQLHLLFEHPEHQRAVWSLHQLLLLLVTTGSTTPPFWLTFQNRRLSSTDGLIVLDSE